VVGRATIRQGDSVLCIGGGPAGLCIAQVAKTRGAGKVFISDPSPLARRIAGQFEALTCIDPSRQSIARVLEEQLDQAAVSAVFDSVGSAETMREAMSLLAESGTYVNLAVHNTSLELNALALGSERTITTSSNALYRDEREAHELIRSGAVDVGTMITHRFRLEDYERAFDLLLCDPREAYKVVFTSF
jgi:L-iditol 2-dehydrogenase